MSDVTVFGCEQDEAVVVRARARELGITPVITSEPVSASSLPLARGSRCISIGHRSPVTRAHLTALSDLGVAYISTRSAGVDHVDVEFASSLGITVENVAYSPGSVADHTLMLMLMALRGMGSVLRRSGARDFRSGEARGRELGDLTVGVVGTGRIGFAVIERLRGFGCRILGYDGRPGASVENVGLDELLRRSDIVTLHVPLDASTHHLLDAAAFERIKLGAHVINTGRGALIDSSALLAALDDGRVAGAALDVVEGEAGVFYTDRRHRPIEDPSLRRLLELPNVIVTPHIAYFTDHALTDAVVDSLANCARYEEGRRHG